MSTPVIGFAQPAIDAVYEDATYDIRKLGTHLTTVDAAWDEVLILATFRNGLQGALAYFGEADRPIYVSEEDTSWFTDMVTAGRMRGWHEDMARDLQFERPRPLMVERVHLNSPLEITLAAAGSTGVTIYALHLLSVVLRHPDSIGGWLQDWPLAGTGRATKPSRHDWIIEGNLSEKGLRHGPHRPHVQAH